MGLLMDSIWRPARSARLGMSWGFALLGLVLLACSGDMDPGGRGGGQGSLSCGEGKIDCGDCVDAARDLLHCGACGNSCGPGQDCVGGQCTCVAPLEACVTGCANVVEDPANCGACGVSCQDGLFCSSGACASSCAAGQTACGASCADLQVSVTNCGVCGNACEPGRVCAGGVCECAEGRVDCGSGCVDLEADVLHCGGCNQACAMGDVCSDGVCRPVNAGSGGTSSGTGGQTSSGGTGGQATGGAASGGAASGGAASGGGNSGGAGSGGGGSDCTSTGFYVQDKKLYDSNCNEFVMRGVNYPYAWYSARDTQQDFDAIRAAGANAVRIVMATGARWTRTSGSNLAQLIGWAKAAELVAIVEVHDTTGWSEQSGSVDLTNATNYWTADDVAGALQGEEAYVILNIGNEPMGNDTTDQWASRHVTAVQALRNAGFEHTLMVDAPNWGQDWENTMRGGAGSAIWNADSHKNLVLSVHMYQVFGTSQIVSTYMNTYLSNNSAPLVVGEFAADHGGDGDVAEDAIMSFAESLGIGYLGWSWSGNGDGLGSLDITNGFDAGSLTTWGNRLIHGENGLGASSEVCSCFD